MKRVPPPPNTKRVPPPPVPKLVVKNFQEKQNHQNLSLQNQQKTPNPTIQSQSSSKEMTVSNINQNPNTNVNKSTPKQEVKQGNHNFQKQRNEFINEVQKSQQAVDKKQVQQVQPRMPPTMKVVPPVPKSRTGSSQDKKRINPPKAPISNLIPKIQETLQTNQNTTQNITKPVNPKQSQQEISTQNFMDPNQVKESKQDLLNVQISLQKQPQKININTQDQNQIEQNTTKQSPKKIIPPPSFKPGNKKAPFQVKPPIKPPTTIKSINNNQSYSLSKQTQQNKPKFDEPKINKDIETQQKPQISKNPIVQQTPLKNLQKNQLTETVDKVEKIVFENQKNQQKIEKIKGSNIKQESPHKFIKKRTDQQPKEYNELQQKLRRLQQLRSKMDQSSQESYSNQQDEIEQDDELQISQNQSQEQEKNNEQIFIQDEKNLESQLRQQKVQDLKVNSQQFAIGQTNLQQMEIKEQNQQLVLKTETLNIQPPQIPVQTLYQQNDIVQPFPEEQSVSLTPVAPQTVYESNISVQQSKRQYLPDELSISPLNSQSSMSKHHQFAHDSSNNVYHAQKYHSQANFDKPKTFSKKNQQDQINQNLHDGGISQKSQNQISKSKHHTNKNQHYQIKDQSIQTLYDKNSLNNDQQNFKENQHPKINLEKVQTNLQKSKIKTTQKNIEDLLKQFRTRKTQYLQNIENLKTKQQKFDQEQNKCRQRISLLIEQVNHKNLLILKHTAYLSDINLKNDKQIQTQEL